ncbi:MAG: GIY-YIG nuclease family protein [Promethearchaeia archaeon]
MQGTYILVLYARDDFSETIGALGEIEFKEGYYSYIGSAMAEKGSATLENRLKRHVKKTSEKSIHWHIDYLLSSENIFVYKIYIIPNSHRLECIITKELIEKSDGWIKKFGSSDCSCPSHLLFFQDLPILE